MLLAQAKGLGYELSQEASSLILVEKKVIIQNTSKGRSTSYDLNWSILEE